jgi:hypothetical protein
MPLKKEINVVKRGFSAIRHHAIAEHLGAHTPDEVTQDQGLPQAPPSMDDPVMDVSES